MDDLLKWRAEFPILERSTYLISNSLGAMPRGRAPGCGRIHFRDWLQRPSSRRPVMSKKVKIRFPDDTMERTAHALENLEAEGGTAVCFWCGHVYHGYSREIEKAHLLECPEYPEESKRAADSFLVGY